MKDDGWYTVVIEDREGVLKVYGDPERSPEGILTARCRLAIQHGPARKAAVVKIPLGREEEWRHNDRLKSWNEVEIILSYSSLKKEITDQ